MALHGVADFRERCCGFVSHGASFQAYLDELREQKDAVSNDVRLVNRQIDEVNREVRNLAQETRMVEEQTVELQQEEKRLMEDVAKFRALTGQTQDERKFPVGPTRGAFQWSLLS